MTCITLLHDETCLVIFRKVKLGFIIRYGLYFIGPHENYIHLIYFIVNSPVFISTGILSVVSDMNILEEKMVEQPERSKVPVRY
jgi:hypothetical protein